jgi:hypothetical protein
VHTRKEILLRYAVCIAIAIHENKCFFAILHISLELSLSHALKVIVRKYDICSLNEYQASK